MTGRFSLCESAKANKGATKNLINALTFDGLIIKNCGNTHLECRA
jgi:hypothetical protein